MISAVILTKDNSATIARTIASLDWADEKLVVDDHSKDDTRAIARKLGCRVIRRTLDDDFAAQRNAGLDAAAGDWVLFVDSDETVSSELAAEILQILPKTSMEGFFLKRTDHIFGRTLRFGETADVKLLRLAKKNAGRWTRPVHEVWDIKGQKGILKNPLHHYPHETVASFLAEINRYTTVNARHLYASGVRVPVWHIVAYPLAKFVKNYLYLGGFRDGTAGMVVAGLMSFHSFLTRGKLYLLNRR